MNPAMRMFSPPPRMPGMSPIPSFRSPRHMSRRSPSPNRKYFPPFRRRGRSPVSARRTSLSPNSFQSSDSPQPTAVSPKCQNARYFFFFVSFNNTPQVLPLLLPPTKSVPPLQQVMLQVITRTRFLKLFPVIWEVPQKIKQMEQNQLATSVLGS